PPVGAGRPPGDAAGAPRGGRGGWPPPPRPPAPPRGGGPGSGGATTPPPPRTWRGTMAKLQANPAVMPRKTRREASMGQGAPSVVCIAILLREVQGDTQEATVPEPTEPRPSGSGSASASTPT